MGPGKRPGGLFLLSSAMLMLAVASACGGSGPGPGREPGMPGNQDALLGEGEKLSVVATTNIVGDVVGHVGGDRIDLTVLMAAGVDPHSYVPTPADTAAVHDAHVVFANGLGLEIFLEGMLDSAGGDAVQIQVSEGLAQQEVESGHVEGEEAGHEHEGADPHVWFDVQNVIRWVETIERTLSALDPAHAEVYAANAGAYRRELEELDTWIVGQVAAIPEDHRKLITNHPVFGHFAGRYGLEQVGAVYPVSPSSEPSAQDIAALEDAIRQYGVPAVFAESTVNPKLAQQVATDTDVKLVPLFTGSLGGPGSGAESYVALMRHDVNAIVEALR
jgi:manganese/iron transport system substrate-binding protein